MGEMSVEEAVEQLADWLYGFSPNLSWWSWKEHAIKVVLDELKALQECDECRIKPGDWCQK